MLEVALGFHDLEHALALHDQFGGLARHFAWHVDDEVLERLVGFAVDLAHEDLRLADLEFVPFAAHGLDQDGQMQDAASVDVPLVFAVGGFDAEREVALEFGVEAFTDVAAGEEFTVFA